MTPELTAEEAAKVAEMVAELHAHGYQDIAELGQLRVGSRIRHVGQQWPLAFVHGTGFVVALTEKPDSPWSRSWGKPDVELIAVWDKPRLSSSRLSQVAQYHVDVIEVADVDA